MATIYFYTLGCKANQYETEKMKDLAIASGYSISQRPKADVVVINTCTVTGHADKKCRQTIKKLRKLNPKAKLIVTGCLAEINPKMLKDTNAVDVILKNQDKNNLLQFLPKGLARRSPPKAGQRRVRQFLMIEDGCDQFCSYCIVPFARGPIKSKPLKEVIAEAKQMTRNNAKEIILTGINLGAFGKDLENKADLMDILKELSKIKGIKRIRLSSIEPMYITDELIDIIRKNKKICRHLHLPLQSGSDHILKLMKRPYTAKDYLRLAKKIKDKFPEIGITTDIIVGFPQETKEDFNQTKVLAKEIGFSRIHAFSFSKRPGTLAEKFSGHIQPSIIKKRLEELQAVRKKLMLDFAGKHLNKTVEILVESRKQGLCEGLTGNYIRVKAKAGAKTVGTIQRVRITKINDEYCEGILIKRWRT